jgi:hypothetical protein
MKFELAITLLSLATVQVATFPKSEHQLHDSLGGSSVTVPRIIKPKYQSTAKRAIIHSSPFTLKAKGVRNLEVVRDRKNI